MIKAIKTNIGIYDVDEEEMLLTFKDMIYKFAHQCNEKLGACYGNTNQFEDFVQIGRIEAIKAFKTYDAEKGNNFSTYLTVSLRNVYVKLVRELNAKKRKAENDVIYMNKDIFNSDEESLNHHSELAVKDKYFEDEENELKDFLLNNLTEEEVVFLKLAMKKNVGKAKGEYKVALLSTIEILEESTIIGFETRAEVAIKFNISRPTLNKRIKETVDKAKRLATIYLNSVEA